MNNLRFTVLSTVFNLVELMNQIRSDQKCLLVIRPKTIIYRDLCLRELVPCPYKRSKLKAETSAHSEAEISESVREFPSLIVWEKKLAPRL